MLLPSHWLMLALLPLASDTPPPDSDPAATGQTSTTASPSADWAIAHYSSFEQLTPAPVLTDARLVADCTMPLPEWERKRHGPHAFAAVTMFMNPAAADAFRAGRTPYPVGSVIVKRKERDAIPDDADPAIKDSLADAAHGAGGMIKREPGYDPAHGDWEYFYFVPPDRIEHGRLESCGRCHEAAKDSDRVFGSWSAR